MSILSDGGKSAKSRKSKKSVSDYLSDENRSYAFHQLARCQPIIYFLPLLKELFTGGEAKTKIVFTMLHTLLTDNRVCWRRADLDEMFHWIDTRHRDYVIHRLSGIGWLEFHRDQNTYMVSDKGEALMRILSRFTMGPELVENEGAALAEIEFSILLDSDDIADRLKFLRHRLSKHIVRAEHALQSESPFMILEIYEQLKSAYRWAEQTRTTLEYLEVSAEEDDLWTTIRDIHDHLSRLHAMISRMQLVLQDIQNKQIDIARYGLSQLDFDHFLVHSTVDELAGILGCHLQRIPHPFFMIADVAFEEARTILTREIAEVRDVKGWDTAVREPAIGGGAEPVVEVERFGSDLARVRQQWSAISNVISAVGWEEAAYRFSLLTLIADGDQRVPALHGRAFDPLIGAPIEVEFDDTAELQAVPCADGMRMMTPGRLRRTAP